MLDLILTSTVIVFIMIKNFVFFLLLFKIREKEKDRRKYRKINIFAIRKNILTSKKRKERFEIL